MSGEMFIVPCLIFIGSYVKILLSNAKEYLQYCRQICANFIPPKDIHYCQKYLFFCFINVYEHE